MEDYELMINYYELMVEEYELMIEDLISEKGDPEQFHYLRDCLYEKFIEDASEGKNMTEVAKMLLDKIPRDVSIWYA